MHTMQQLLSGELAGAARAKMACGLTTFPRELFQLADTLEILDLSGNQLSALPDDFDRFTRLKILFCSDNLFTELPEVLGRCAALEMVGFKSNKIHTVNNTALPARLRWLILTNNCVTVLPDSIGNCYRLEKCMLAGNRLTALPDSMQQCKQLGLLRISANLLPEIPVWLYSMPRLAWLAFAGNPVAFRPQLTALPGVIHWHELDIAHQLGEGASGFVSTGRWMGDAGLPEGRAIAVKVFKGDVTSDGLPGEEMNACMAAGNHPHLVPVIGQIAGHPQEKRGLVLNLIPPAFRNLGNPPDFVSCTRDTFPAGMTFSAATLLAVAKAMASAGAHLHERGIMHGDLYAHNILIDDNGGVLLVDYGAASIYDREGAAAAAIERWEVRAYGNLLDDLIRRLAPEDRLLPVVKEIEALRGFCLCEEVLERPGFEEIKVKIQNSGVKSEK